ncbi:MAG: outer membrane beta-barrel protein [Thermoanaerobaculia bacterium]|jgi:hypothetical protein
MNTAIKWILAALTTLASVSAMAQDGQSVVLYVLGAAIDGTVGIGPVETDTDVSASDIFSNLEMGGMAAYRNDTGRWSWSAEGIFMGLGNADTAADVDVDELMLAATAGYELNDRMELIGGVRYMDIESKVRLSGPVETRSAKTSADWIDPFFGVRALLPLSDRSSVVLQGTVGGFGVGSDLAVDAGGFFEYAFSDRASAMLGYRLLDVDYEDGSGADYFKYDTTTQGPAAGVRFRF